MNKTPLILICLFGVLNNSFSQNAKSLGFNVNTEFDESHPLMTADGKVLYFTSNKPLLPVEQKRNQAARSNVYRSLFNEDNQQWGECTPLPEIINDPESNNIAFALSNDGQLMLFYRKDKNGNGTVLATKLIGNTWEEPRAINDFGLNINALSGSIGSDNRTFYFVGMSEKDTNNADIWKGKISEQGSVYDIVRIKEQLNSEDNESAVFIHPDGQHIYLSSNRNSSFGGYDIYEALLDGEKWKSPIKLSTSINTNYSEFGFALSASGEFAIFSSNLDDNQFDLYSLQMDNNAEKKKGLTLLHGIVKDADTGSPISAVFNVSSLNNQVNFGTYQSNVASGTFLISLPDNGGKYAINVLNNDYLPFSENIASTSSFIQAEHIISLQKIKIGNLSSLKNITFSENNSLILPESAIEINQFYQFLVTHPSIKIELSIYTKDPKTDLVDKSLSMKRSIELKNQLIRLGIDKKRIRLLKLPKLAKIGGLEGVFYTIVKI